MHIRLSAIQLPYKKVCLVIRYLSLSIERVVSQNNKLKVKEDESDLTLSNCVTYLSIIMRLFLLCRPKTCQTITPFHDTEIVQTKKKDEIKCGDTSSDPYSGIDEHLSKSDTNHHQRGDLIETNAPLSIDALLKQLEDIKPASTHDLSTLKEKLFDEGWLHYSSIDMVAALNYFGALTEDLIRVADPTSSPYSELWFHEPLLPHKKTQASRAILRKRAKNNKSEDDTNNTAVNAGVDGIEFEGCDSKSVVRYEVNKKQVDFGEYWKEANSKVRSWELLPD